MIKKLQILFIVSLLQVSYNIKAQKTEVTWGDGVRGLTVDKEYEFLAENDHGIFILKTKEETKHRIERYNSNTLQKEFSIKLHFKGKLQFNKIYVVDSGIFVFATKYKHKVLSLYAQKLNFDGKPVGEWQLLASIKRGDKWWNRGQFHVQLSEDKKQFLITGKMPLFENNPQNPVKYFFNIYNLSLAKLSETESLLETSIILEKIKIKMHGENILILSGYIDFCLFSIKMNQDGNTEVKKYCFDKKFASMNYNLDTIGGIFVTGLYIDTSTGEIAGALFYKFNSSLSPIITETSDFTDELKNKLIINDGVFMDIPGMPSGYEIKDCMIKTDGSGAFAVAENSYALQAVGNSTYGVVDRDILVLNIHSDGKIFSHHIPKPFTPNSNFGKSYRACYLDNKLYIFYNLYVKKDNITNAVEDFLGTQEKLFVMTTISDDGEIQTTEFFREKDYNRFVLADETLFIKNNKGLILGGRKKYYFSIGRLEFD